MNEVEDALKAVTIAIDYSAKKGIIIFRSEVDSAILNDNIWNVKVESHNHKGEFHIDNNTGTVLSAELIKKNTFSAIQKSMGVVDALEAVKISLDYCAKKGIVIYINEVLSVYIDGSVWIIEIESPFYCGFIQVNSLTREIDNRMVTVKVY